MTEKLQELIEGTIQRLGISNITNRETQELIANQLLSYLASMGACFPVSKEDIEKIPDSCWHPCYLQVTSPTANTEIVVTLKEMMEK